MKPLITRIGADLPGRIVHTLGVMLVAGTLLLLTIETVAAPGVLLAAYTGVRAADVADREPGRGGGRDEAERRRLRAETETALSAATERLPRLRAAAQRVEAEFFEITRVPLDRAGGHSGHRPADVDDALRNHQAFRDAWLSVVRAYVSPEDLAEAEAGLAAVEQGLRSDTFEATDRARVAEIDEWIETRLSAVAAQRQEIERLRTILTVVRFERAGQFRERSDP